MAKAKTTPVQEEPAADLNYKQEETEKPTSSADDIGVTFDDLF